MSNPQSPSLGDSGGGSPPASPTVRTGPSRLVLPRSLSRSSMRWSVADTPKHHNYGTSYFPSSIPSTSTMSSTRATSPNSKRTVRPVPLRSASVGSSRPAGARTSSVSRGMRDGTSVLDEENEDDDDDDDDDLREDSRLRSSVADIEAGGEDEDEDPITLRERQSLINVEHPFGLPIWKPALYKKTRSVTRYADQALHSIPSAQAQRHLLPGNILWTLVFGWWLALVCIAVAAVLYVIPRGGKRYARLTFGLGWYLGWPFGKFVEGDIKEGSLPEDEEHPRDDAEEYRAGPSTSSAGPSKHSSRAPMTHSHSTSWVPAGEDTSLLGNGRAAPNGVLIAPVRSYGATSSSSWDEATDLKEDRARDWLGKIFFWLALACVIAPLMLLVCAICWGLVVTIPMAKLNWALLEYMFRRADSIRFCAPPAVVIPADTILEENEEEGQSDTTPTHNGGGSTPVPRTYAVKQPKIAAGQVAPSSGSPTSTVLLCTYQAIGLKYYKYTVGGVNIFFINLLPIVFFVIFDGFVLMHILERLEEEHKPIPWLLKAVAGRVPIFVMCLLSVIPLSYFLGMAVASISAQSSIGMGAVINATFGSIIEIILYGIALADGKGRLVEGSIIGSLLAGVLLMPGMSMCSGAIRRKEQKFNARSAGVTSTMLIMAIIGTLTPTLFYQTYGNFKLICEECPPGFSDPKSCQNCYYEHPDPATDPFYQGTVKSLMYFCATILVLSYLVGLWFSLRTHASHIWQKPRPPQEIPVPNRLSLYQKLVPSVVGASAQSHNLAGSLRRKQSTITNASTIPSRSTTPTPRAHDHGQHILIHEPEPSAAPTVPPTPSGPPRVSYANLPAGQTQAGYAPLLESVDHAMKDTGLQPGSIPGNMTTADFTRAVAVATVSALRHQQNASHSPARVRVSGTDVEDAAGHGGHGGHDAPSWSRGVSASVLIGCTFLYAIIAELLVDVIDVVLEGSGIDEKFLGITLLALVPNTTEFMNAMAFAMGGNIALSMEIGSAYALQVCLLQIPAMVAFSAWRTPGIYGRARETFTLIFPRWDVIVIILSVFLMTYTYIEAKSNYHRGSILIFSYVVLIAGFYFAPHRGDEQERDFTGTSTGSFSVTQSFQLFLSSIFSL